MAHLLVVERDPVPHLRPRTCSIREVLESTGHRVTVLQSTSEVIPFLREAGEPIDGVVLSMLQQASSTRSFDVVKELCRISDVRELAKILVFPPTADRREHEQMYGERGYASYEPQLHRTVAVSESNLSALTDAISFLETDASPAGKLPDGGAGHLPG
jgi:hypothetical protein